MDFSSWIGNSVTRQDTINKRMVDHFKDSLAPHCFLTSRCRRDCFGV